MRTVVVERTMPPGTRPPSSSSMLGRAVMGSYEKMGTKVPS
jgi:hypothetical protein